MANGRERFRPYSPNYLETILVGVAQVAETSAGPLRDLESSVLTIYAVFNVAHVSCTRK